MKEILTKYQDEITEINGNPEWWVFDGVAAHFNYEILMAEAEEIGYKRGKRGEQRRRNDLFLEDEHGNIIFNTEGPETILDWLKTKIKWD